MSNSYFIDLAEQIYSTNKNQNQDYAVLANVLLSRQRMGLHSIQQEKSFGTVTNVNPNMVVKLANVLLSRHRMGLHSIQQNKSFGTVANVN